MTTDQQRDAFGGLTYAARELQDVLDAGPFEGEDFYRLKVSGAESSKWINVSGAQLAAIVAIVNETPAREGWTS